MICFTTGNLLESDAEALVNTVNTVGVMGKGIALMFKEAFPANFLAYREACKQGRVRIGSMFVTDGPAIGGGPRWLINFPTKEHWRGRTKLSWVESGLDDLVRVLRDLKIRSVAIPPLGCGNGGLDWADVRPLIESRLAALEDVDVTVFEPAPVYHNVTKRVGVKKLTVPRALIAEAVRRYWIPGIGCSVIEIQKLAWFLDREIEALGLPNPLHLRFTADRYGPYSDRLRHLLDSLDGSYLRSERRLADARPFDTIAFNDTARGRVAAYLESEAKDYLPVLDRVSRLLSGFESPLGLELLATVDWLLRRCATPPDVRSIQAAMARWPGGVQAAERKRRIFDDEMIGLALTRLVPSPAPPQVRTGQGLPGISGVPDSSR